MTLLDGEIKRIKYELGYTTVLAGAEPYISVAAVFDQVIQTYLSDGSVTTSSTVVTAAAEPTPVAITLASATGFAASGRIVLDVDSRQEVATIQSLAGSVATVLLSLAHSGTYPVATEDGESIVRQILRALDKISERIGGPGAAGGASAVGLTAAGLKQVDEVIFATEGGASSGSGGTVFDNLKEQRDYWRDELASALGVVNLRSARAGGGGGSMELY